jgi:hypothetical protein
MQLAGQLAGCEDADRSCRAARRVRGGRVRGRGRRLPSGARPRARGLAVGAAHLVGREDLHRTRPGEGQTHIRRPLVIRCGTVGRMQCVHAVRASGAVRARGVRGDGRRSRRPWRPPVCPPPRAAAPPLIQPRAATAGTPAGAERGRPPPLSAAAGARPLGAARPPPRRQTVRRASGLRRASQRGEGVTLTRHRLCSSHSTLPTVVSKLFFVS